MSGVNTELQNFNIDTIKKAINVTFPSNDAYSFLVDTINNAGTLSKLPYMIKPTPAGNIEALTQSTMKIRLADDDSNAIPTGVGGATKRQIPYAVKKVFWDEWIKNDDVIYNAVRQVVPVAQQTGITNTADLETLLIQMLQKAFAMDLQMLAFMGDTAYPVAGANADFFKIVDGFVKKALTAPNITDLTTNAMTLADLATVAALLPEEFKNNFSDNIKWFMSRSSHDKIVALLMARQTAFGDAILQNGQIQSLFGYPVEVVSGLSGPLKNPVDASAGRKGFIMLTPEINLVPIMTQDLKYRRASDDVMCLKKDSTYHILHAYLDAVIRETRAISVLVGEKV